MQVIVYVFVSEPSVTSISSVSVFAVQVTVEPVNAVPFNSVNAVDVALSVV